MNFPKLKSQGKKIKMAVFGTLNGNRMLSLINFVSFLSRFAPFFVLPSKRGMGH